MKKKYTVKMVEDGPINMTYTQNISHVEKLGREITISKNAGILVNYPGFTIEYATATVSCLIGIGKDHTAELIMTKDAWDALTSNEKLSITNSTKLKAIIED